MVSNTKRYRHRKGYIKQGVDNQDYLSIRIPNYNDVPLVKLKGKDCCNENTGLESVKFIWVSEYDRDVFSIPYLDVKLISGIKDNQPERMVKGIGNETESELKRKTINLSKEASDVLCNKNENLYKEISGALAEEITRRCSFIKKNLTKLSEIEELEKIISLYSKLSRI